MARKGKQLLYESFEDRPAAIIVGLFCLAYFFVSYIPENGLIAKILPVWPLRIFGIIVGITLIAQLIIWKLFRHFDRQSTRDFAVWILFACEFGLVLFTILFISWPVYWLYTFFMAPRV